MGLLFVLLTLLSIALLAAFNDYLLFGLSLKTLCTPVSIQGIGLKLLGSEVALSHCNDPNETMKIYKIYMRWRQQMNEQRKNLDEMAELLRRALIETENAMALVFLDGFLNPSSEPRQETRKSANSSVFYCSSSFVLFQILMRQLKTLLNAFLPR